MINLITDVTTYRNKEREMIRDKVEETLAKVRPALQADGGDVELVDVSDDGTVKLKLTGACGHCPMSTLTLKMGIERALKQQVPEVKEVVAV
jgi:Fe-S cluster biogenesis protein NfuA